MIHVPVSCVVNAGRVELFTDVPGRRGFGRDIPVSTPASGCVRVVVGRPVSTTVGRVGRGVPLRHHRQSSGTRLRAG